MAKSISREIKSNSKIPDNKKPYLKEISMGMDGIRDVLKTLSEEKSPVASILIMKSIIIEIYNIYELCKDAGISKNTVTKFYDRTSLKELRNSICHIKDRVKLTAKAPRGQSKALNWERNSIAGGLATSNDNGKTWEVCANNTINFRFNGLSGASTTVGRLDTFLVCQSEHGCLAVDLSEDNFNNFYDSIASSIININQ